MAAARFRQLNYTGPSNDFLGFVIQFRTGSGEYTKKGTPMKIWQFRLSTLLLITTLVAAAITVVWAHYNAGLARVEAVRLKAKVIRLEAELRTTKKTAQFWQDIYNVEFTTPASRVQSPATPETQAEPTVGIYRGEWENDEPLRNEEGYRESGITKPEE